MKKAGIALMHVLGFMLILSIAITGMMRYTSFFRALNNYRITAMYHEYAAYGMMHYGLLMFKKHKVHTNFDQKSNIILYQGEWPLTAERTTFVSIIAHLYNAHSADIEVQYTTYQGRIVYYSCPVWYENEILKCGSISICQKEA